MEEARSYLTPIQVSVRTGIKKSTLARWRRDGRGPIFVKRGTRIEYPAQALELWLRAWREEQAADELWGFG
jgi:predicted site-specific integrase-resolvase